MKSDYRFSSWKYADECGADGMRMKIYSPSYDKSCYEPLRFKKQDFCCEKKPEFPCFEKKPCWDHKPEYPCWDHKPEFPCREQKPECPHFEKKHCPKCFPCFCCPCRFKFPYPCPMYKPVNTLPDGVPIDGAFPPGGPQPV